MHRGGVVNAVNWADLTVSVPFIPIIGDDIEQRAGPGSKGKGAALATWRSRTCL